MYKHSNVLAAALTLGLTTGVGAQVNPTGRPAPVPSPRASVPTEAPDATAIDEVFARKVAAGSAAEIELAELAQQQSSTDHVKHVARRIETDHKKANDELMAIASRMGLDINPKPTADQIKVRMRLEKLRDSAFDRAYLDAMVKDHQKDIKEFERHASTGANPELKGFASKMLPDLKAHLELAQEAQRALTSTSQ
jgi:putative membrane protein